MKKSEEIALHKQIRNQFSFDRLKMYFCEDYQTQSGIIVREPRIGEILKIGEEDFYKNLNIWITNPTAYRVPLWHLEPSVDWCKITDFELFCYLYKAIDPDVISIIFPGINILSFEQKYRVLGEEQYELVLYSEEQDEVIDNNTYLEISQYLRTLFNIFPKDEYGKGRSTKEAMIWEDEEKAAREKDKSYKSSLYPLVSSCINHPGFKHSLADLRDVGIFEFMDSVNRLQVYENTRALLAGSMSGFADTSKIDKENFNFMRDFTVSSDKDKGQQSNNDNNTFKRVIENYNKK